MKRAKIWPTFSEPLTTRGMCSVPAEMLTSICDVCPDEGEEKVSPTL